MVGFIEYVVIGVLIFGLILTRNIHEFAMPGVARDPDGYVHMVIAREFRENDHRIPENISVSLFNWRFSYPFLLHFLLSFIPERYYESIDKMFPTVMDLLYVGTLALLIPLDLLNITEFTIVLALFVTTPQFIQHAGGKGLSARKPGILLGTVSLLSFFVWSTGGNIWALLVSIFFAGLTHLTSRFGTQAISFIYLGFFAVQSMSLLIIVGSLIVAIVLSLGKYAQILYTHLLFLHMYAVRGQFTTQYNGFKSIDTVKQLLNSRTILDILSTVYESTLLKVLLNNPFAIGATMLLVWMLQQSKIIVPIELTIWFISGLIMCILTTVYGLRFLGQPGRYLTFAFIPGVLIITEFGFDYFESSLFTSLLMSVGLVMIFGLALAYSRFSTSPKETQSLNKCIEYMDSHDLNRVVVQPRHLGSEIAWKSGMCVSDYFGDWWPSLNAKKQIRRIQPDGVHISNDIEYLSKLFHPQYVLFDKDIESSSQDILKPPSSEPLYENEYYEIYCWKDIISNMNKTKKVFNK